MSMSAPTFNLGPRRSRQPQTRRCITHEDAALARHSQTPLGAAKRTPQCILRSPWEEHARIARSLPPAPPELRRPGPDIPAL
eukprot:3570982-Heterocapsa_arctica.AAC.1